jgi:mannose-1-phosphate guanylyltransferase/phosphomannomutase
VVVTDKKGKITEFQEKPPVEEAKSNLVNTGIYIFEPKVFDYIPKDTFYDFAKQVFPALMKDHHPIYGFKINNYWNDIGTLLQYRLSSYDVLKENVRIEVPGEKVNFGWRGKNCEISASAKIKKKVLLGDSCIIKANVTLDQYCTFGNNCAISENSTIIGCQSWNNLKVGRNAHLQYCLIGNNVTIEDNVTIEKGTIISDNSYITKGQHIKEDQKIPPNTTL